MRFKMHVRDCMSDWWEEYDKNTKDAQKLAEDYIRKFNETLREFERERELLEVVILDEKTIKDHDWEKLITGMSVCFRGDIVDIFYCRRCGITGKRKGLSAVVKRDSKYRRKEYARCDTSLEYQRKRRIEGKDKNG